MASQPESSHASTTIEVAITFDDLPGDPEAAAQIFDVLAQHHVPPSYGFVNGRQLDARPERAEVLTEWLARGHRLGNHTLSHPHMQEIGVDAYVRDIDANQAILDRVAPAAPRFFRYPFLEQGFDAASTSAVRRHLAEERYRVAEVTIDFGDWAWNEAYARCAERNDERAIAALESSFLGMGRAYLRWGEEAGRRAFGRSIPHVLLLHVGAFTAAKLDALLSGYEAQGVTFITLEDALADPAYTEHVPPDQTHGDSLIEQVVTTRGADHPPWILQPLALLDAVCR